MNAKPSAFLAVLLFAGLARPALADDVPGKAKPESPKLDAFGDPLPPGAYARFGTLRFRDWASAGAFLDKNTIVSVGSRIRTWDAATGRLITERRPEKTDGYCLRAAISGNGKCAVVLHDWDTYSAWDIPSGKLLREFKVEQIPPLTSPGDGGPRLSISDDGSRFAAQTWRDDQKLERTICGVRIFAVDSKSNPIQLNTGSQDVLDFSLSPSGKQIATNWEKVHAHDKSVRILALWDAVSGKQLRTEDPKLGLLTQVRYLQSGDLLVIGVMGMVLQNPEGKEIWRRPNQSDYGSGLLCATPDHLVWADYECGEGTHKIVVIDAKTGKDLRTCTIGGWASEDRFAVSPDASRIVIAYLDRLRLFDLSDGSEITKSIGHTGQVEATCLTLDGRFIASAGWGDSDIILWDVQTGNECRRLKGLIGSVKALAISPDDKFIAAAGMSPHDRVIEVWEIATGRQVVEIVNQNSEVSHLCFLADGSQLAVVNSFPKVAGVIYEWRTGRKVREISISSNGPVGLTRHPDGRLLAIIASSDQEGVSEINIWDGLAGRVYRNLKPKEHGVQFAVLSFDGRTLATRGYDNMIRLWEMASGQQRLSFHSDDLHRPIDITHDICAFSPDCRTLATANDIGTSVNLCDLRTGKSFASFSANDRGTKTVNYSRDGNRLLTGGRDTTILAWDMTRPEWQSRPVRSNLGEKDLATHWERLRNGNAEEAYRSEWEFVGDPKKTVDFLAARLHAAPAIRPERVQSWIADLDSEEYAARERAQGELQRHFDQAEELLRKALAGNVSAEVRSRINRILDANFAAIPEPDQLRDLRAIEVLEQIGTPEARELLRRIAKSEVPTAISRDAAESLKRLERRGQ